MTQIRPLLNQLYWFMFGWFCSHLLTWPGNSGGGYRPFTIDICWGLLLESSDEEVSARVSWSSISPTKYNVLFLRFGCLISCPAWGLSCCTFRVLQSIRMNSDFSSFVLFLCRKLVLRLWTQHTLLMCFSTSSHVFFVKNVRTQLTLQLARHTKTMGHSEPTWFIFTPCHEPFRIHSYSLTQQGCNYFSSYSLEWFE